MGKWETILLKLSSVFETKTQSLILRIYEVRRPFKKRQIRRRSELRGISETFMQIAVINYYQQLVNCFERICTHCQWMASSYCRMSLNHSNSSGWVRECCNSSNIDELIGQIGHQIEEYWSEWLEFLMNFETKNFANWFVFIGRISWNNCSFIY